MIILLKKVIDSCKLMEMDTDKVIFVNNGRSGMKRLCQVVLIAIMKSWII